MGVVTITTCRPCVQQISTLGLGKLPQVGLFSKSTHLGSAQQVRPVTLRAYYQMDGQSPTIILTRRGNMYNSDHREDSSQGVTTPVTVHGSASNSLGIG